MIITRALLRKHVACEPQMQRAAELWPDGAAPTVEVLTEAAAEGLDVLWLLRLLPAEGPGSRRAFALWCAEQVAHLCPDERVTQCLATVRRRVADPGAVSDADLEAAWAAAWAAAGEAAWDAFDHSMSVNNPKG